MGNNNSSPVPALVGTQSLMDFGAGDISSTMMPKPEFVNRNAPVPTFGLTPGMQYSQNAYWYENKYNHMKTNIARGIQEGVQSLFSGGGIDFGPTHKKRNKDMTVIKPYRNGQIPGSGALLPTL